MRANILTLDEGERLLVPYLSTIRQALLEAFARWQALSDQERLYLSTQARAFYIHDMAIGLVVPNFRGTKVQIVECNLLKLLNIEERALLRFAKFGPGLTTSKEQYPAAAGLRRARPPSGYARGDAPRRWLRARPA